MKLDYSIIELDNTGGTLSTRYPPRIFIPEYEYGERHVSSTDTANSGNIPSSCNSSSGFESGFDSNSSTFNGDNMKSKKANYPNSPHRSKASPKAASPILIDVSGINKSIITTTINITSEQKESATDHHNTNRNGNGCSVNTNSESDNGTNSFVNVGTKFTLPQRSQQQQRTIYEDLFDISKIRDYITYARYARCRQRFVVPVILYRGKLICRSATLSVIHETYSRYAFDYITSGNNTEPQQQQQQQQQQPRMNGHENPDSTEDSLLHTINDSPSPFSYNEVIKNDVSLLNSLNVNTIVDLMVEQRKIKYFMTVSSSEKADPDNNYEKFNILSLPYPGCEFFTKFRDNNYMAKGLHYNWELPFNDADISIPKIGPAMDLAVNWEDYQKWDLVAITQNYLKAMLKYLQEENTGLLVHCISGWDRTPLFISLLRLSLWADGLIHQSLDHIQITYFTLAYDWYLFGHQLPDREKRGEDIMLFCFHMLKFLSSEEFSLVEQRKRTKTSSSSGSSTVAPKQEDETPLRDDVLLIDQDSNDSIPSDLGITDNLNTMTIPHTPPPLTTTTSSDALTSRSPNPKRSRTSPISVPGANARRQRQESVSSNGSWQVVTETGSIDSMAPGSYMRAGRNSTSRSSSSSDTVDSSTASSNSSGSSGISGGSTNSNGSNNNITNGSTICNGANNVLPTTTEELEVDGTDCESNRRRISRREKRLNQVRAIFIRVYGKAVGLKFRDGSSMTITTLIGTLF
ncbi:myotubularin-related protein 14 isoform X2 [Eurosta solidaginis]